MPAPARQIGAQALTYQLLTLHIPSLVPGRKLSHRKSACQTHAARSLVPKPIHITLSHMQPVPGISAACWGSRFRSGRAELVYCTLYNFTPEWLYGKMRYEFRTLASNHF